MIVAILLGRKGSIGFPGKNLHPVLGRPLVEYPLLAAVNSKVVDEVYVSTDDDEIKEIGRKYGANIIDRPAYLCTKEALGEDAYKHAYFYVKDTMGRDLELLILLFANAPCVLPEQIEEGVQVLRENPDYDSAVTCDVYNMFSPIRARKIGEDGLLHPFIPFDGYDQNMKINCDRDSQGDVYFADVCLSVIRPYCLEDLSYGVLPQKWMGQKIYPIIQWGGLDVDYEWQLPQIEFWLKKHSYTESELPYPDKSREKVE